MNTPPESSDSSAKLEESSSGLEWSRREIFWLLLCVVLALLVFPYGKVGTFGSVGVLILLVVGWWRAWPKAPLVVPAVSLIVVGVAVADGLAFRSSARHSLHGGILGNLRQIAAAIDQTFRDNPSRLFLRYDEVIGPNVYMKAVNPISGEDYHVMFPVQRNAFADTDDGLGEPVVRKVVCSDGAEVSYDEMGFHPAAMPDGVHKVVLKDGRRIETTFLHGVRDGPFRAYYADGKPWCTAEYAQGRVVGPVWFYAPNGRKFDELAGGAAKALAEWVEPEVAARKTEAWRKAQAGDMPGAIAELTAAIDLRTRAVTDLRIDEQEAPELAELHRLRADAERSIGAWDGAIADYTAANPAMQAAGANYRGALPDALRALFLQRAQVRRANGDLAGADQDTARVLHDVSTIAAQQRGAGDLAGALKSLEIWAQLAPSAERHQTMAEVHIQLGEGAAAEAEYDRAIELAAQGKMDQPQTQKFAPAAYIYGRGHARRLAGKSDAAIEDFRTIARYGNYGETLGSVRALLWIYFVECERGNRAAATAELEKVDKRNWSAPNLATVAYLLGHNPDLTAVEKAGPAQIPNGPFDAAFYSAMQLKLAGNRLAARKEFERAYYLQTPHGPFDFNVEETKRQLAEPAKSDPAPGSKQL